MDIKQISPQNLFLRLLAVLAVLLVWQKQLNQKILAASLLNVLLFSIFIALSMVFVLKYVKQEKMSLGLALTLKGLNWPISLFCWFLIQVVLALPASGFTFLGLWLSSEGLTWLVQTLFQAGRRNGNAG